MLLFRSRHRSPLRHKGNAAPGRSRHRPLSRDEEKMLKDLFTQFGTKKDKDGNVMYDARALKQYELWFRERSPAETRGNTRTNSRLLRARPPVSPKHKPRMP